MTRALNQGVFCLCRLDRSETSIHGEVGVNTTTPCHEC